jgi:hypothetical protein
VVGQEERWEGKDNEGTDQPKRRIQQVTYRCREPSMEASKQQEYSGWSSMMGYQRRDANPCLYSSEKVELCIWLTWINSCIVIGTENAVARESAKLMSLFKCEDMGPMVSTFRAKWTCKMVKNEVDSTCAVAEFFDEFGAKEKCAH